MEAREIFLSFTVSVVQAPEYPTAEQIALAITEYFRNEILSLRADFHLLTDSIESSLVFVSALSIISFALSIIVLASIFYMNRKVSELTEWGIRHEAEHRRRGE